MEYIGPVFFIFAAFYAIILLLVAFSFFLPVPRRQGTRPFISVVIAAKNEQGRLEPLLRSLEKLDYPVDRHEVIFVDDASSDQTRAILERAAAEKPHWQVLHREQPSDKYHAKKMALADGVARAQGEWIVVTDADCRVPAGWLKGLSSCFTADTIMVLGHSPLESRKGILDRWLKFDNLFSSLVLSAPTKWGFALSSLGRNMAFKKAVYQQVGGYRAVTRFRSGDDIHLMELFRDSGLGKIRVCDDPQTFVYTQPPDTLKAIFFQQIRKNSKILDKSLKTAIFSVVLFFMYLLFYLLPLFDFTLLNVWLYFWLIKMGVEFLILAYAAQRYRVKEVIPYLPLFQLLYPPYVMLLGVVGYLHVYDWK